MSDELAKRAIACKGWRWLPGMLGCEPLPYIDNDGSEVWYGGEHYRVTDAPGLDVIRMELRETFGVTRYLVPVLTDPCTLGGLLHLVREAWGEPSVFARPFGGGTWQCWYWRDDGQVWPCGDLAVQSPATEAEALVAALEGAP